MKKFICVLVFLAMVNLASAGIVDITITSLNGQPITPTKEIEIFPSDVIDMQIVFNAPTSEYLFAISSVINVVGPGKLDWSQFVHAVWDDIGEMWVYDDLSNSYDAELHARGDDWIVEGALAKGKRGSGVEAWVIKDILMHCEGPGRVLVYLTDYVPGGGTIVIDTNYNQIPWAYGPGVVVTQLIPEPMTITLLGLGGLLLARRKK